MAISAEQIADWNRRTEARSFWMRANGYEEPRGRAPESWWGFSDRFWHRVLGVKTWRYKDWERCHNGCPQLPGDHWDAFGRGKRISALVTQPYYGPALDEYEAAWRAAAVQYGLRLYVSAEESWHKPGKTVLFVLSTPDDGGR